MKVLSFLIAASALLSASSVWALDDPGFEEWNEDGTLIHWIKESNVNLVQTTDTVYHDAYSVGLESTGSANRGIYQDVVVADDTCQEFCVYFYPVVNTGENDMGIVISWYDADNFVLGYTGPA